MRITIIALAMLGGCATTADSRYLSDGSWLAVNINGLPVEGRPITLQLQDGRVSGTASCNSYFGTVQRFSRERLRFDGVGSTRAACADPALAEQERRFLSILEAVEGYSFYSDGSLSLIAGDGRAIRFRRGG